jgi:hypothetical protein
VTNATSLTPVDALPKVGADAVLAKDVETYGGTRFERGEHVTVTRIEQGEIYFGMRTIEGVRISFRAADGREFPRRLSRSSADGDRASVSSRRRARVLAPTTSGTGGSPSSTGKGARRRRSRASSVSTSSRSRLTRTRTWSWTTGRSTGRSCWSASVEGGGSLTQKRQGRTRAQHPPAR